LKNGKLAIVLALVLILLLSACSNNTNNTKSEDENPANPKGNDEKKITMIFDTIGARTDGSWSQGIFEAYEYIKATYPEVEASFTDLNPPAEFPAILDKQAADGADIIYVEDAWYEALLEVAPKYPNTKFIMTHLDQGRLDKLPDNVTSPNSREEEGAFLSGVAAALMTKSDKIAYIQAVEGSAPLVRAGHGYFSGAQYINPNIETIMAYTGDWVDVQKGYMTADTVINQGADVIMHFTDNAGLGVIKAAEEKGVYIIGEALDQIQFGPKSVLTSFLVPHDKLAEWALENYKAGTLKKEIIEFGVKEGWPVLAPLTNMPDDVKAKIEEVKQKIISGEIIVENKTSRDDLKQFE
jgi:basic membrane protein A